MNMLQIEELQQLKSLNTFGIEAIADYFIILSSVEEVKEFVKNPRFKQIPHLVLGSGSNILFTGNYRGIILKSNITGIEIIDEDSDSSTIRCGAGEAWDDLVAWSVKHGLGGLENLSLIPGTVGASPIQNIGAYGVEVKESIVRVEGYRSDKSTFFSINNYDCKFGYRTSIFKTLYKNKFMVTHVVFRLSKKPEFKIEYGNVTKEIEKLGNATLKNIRQAIINIRTRKLPDPAKIGNAGSFFKNPVIIESKALRIKKSYPDLPLYKSSGDQYKIPAAFLIEKCGWKGYREGDTGVHMKQSLVLVNYGNAKGIEILHLAHLIQESVRKKFEIDLEMEVEIIA